MFQLPDYDNIVVPLDGSPNSKLAFRRALKMAEDQPKDRLHLVHAVDEAADLTSADDAFVETIDKDDLRHLKRYQAVAKKHHVKASCAVAVGPPKAMIANNFVRHYHANLIVMGANGLNSLERFVMGSVAVYVSREAPCDVLVVKEK